MSTPTQIAQATYPLLGARDPTLEYVGYTSMAQDQIIAGDNTQHKYDYDGSFYTGALYAPLVYGGGLTSFEVASSGKIAMTVFDVHSLDLSRSVGSSSNVILSTLSNDSLLFNVHNEQMSMTFDSASNNVTLAAANTIKLDASSIELATTAMTIGATEELALSAGTNLFVDVTSNIAFRALDRSFEVYAHNSNMSFKLDADTDIVQLRASNGMHFAVSNDVRIVADSGDMFLSARDSTAYAAFTDSNIKMQSSNLISMLAANDIDMTATAGHFKVAVAGSNVILNLDDVEKTAYLYANKDIDFTASNDIKQVAQSNVYVTASDGSMTLSANYNNVQVVMADSNYTLTASNDVKVVAASDIDMTATAGHFKVAVADSNVVLNLDDVEKTAYLYANKDIDFTASNDIKQVAQSNVYVTATDGSMTLSADNSTVQVVMADSNYTLTASNDVKVVASSDIDMTATAGHFKVAVAGSNVVLNLDDVEKTAYLYANKDIDFTASNDIKQVAQSNVYVTASDGSMTLSANYNNVQVVMADSNYTLTASNDIKVVASSDIDMTAMNGNFYVAAAESNVTLKLDNLNRSAYVYAQNEVKLTASNEMVQWAKNNVKVTASEGSMTLAANYNTAVINMANSNITASASNDFALNAKNNVTLTAETQSFLASAAADDVRIKLDHIDQSANVYAKGAIHINTSNSMYTKTTGDYRLTACNAIYTTAQNSIDMRAMGESFRISATNDQSYAMFSGDIAINTVGSFRTTATSNVELTATTGDYIMAATGADSFIKMTAETDTVSLKAGANIQSTASNMYTVYGKNKVRMEVDATKAYMDLDVLAQSAKVYGALDAILESGQTVNLKSGDSTTVEAATDLHIKTNGNTQTIDMTAGVFSANVTNNYNLKVNGIERFSVNANRVKIDGDLEITGVLNTVNMTNTTLSVEDKYIHLSTNSDGTITNDEAISQSGIFVDGLPTMASSNVDLNKECYQKSFMWNNGKKANGGILALGSTAVQDIDQESYWEVKGGSFRITTPVNVQRDGNNDVTAAFDIVSYAFRVSDIGSLQIVKMLTKAGDAPNTVPEITVMTEIGGLGGVVREPRVITA